MMKRKHIKWMGLLFLCCMSACNQEMPSGTETTDASEEVVLRLNVEHERVIQTRAANLPAEDEKITSMDFLVFNAAGKIVLHEQASPEWTGTSYQMTIIIPPATGTHTLYLVANHAMPKGTINTLQELEKQTVNTTTGLVAPPFVMSTSRITLPELSATAVLDAMSVGNAFTLKRNVAKFSVEVTAANFKLTSVQWVKCFASATVLPEVDYTNPDTLSVSNPDPVNSPVYLYRICNMGSDPHQGFHVIVSGEYTATDGTTREGYYKLRLNTVNGSGNKVPLESIVGNNYYKLNIRSVSGFGAHSLESAKANGFTNEMEALTIWNYTGSHSYQENYLRNGYQMGFENSHWIIYNSKRMESLFLGYCYRTIRDQSLNGHVSFDPDYPELNRGALKVNIDGEWTTKTIICKDIPGSPVEMEMSFSDLENEPTKGYVYKGIMQYGVLQQEVVVERKPSVGRSYTVLPMLNTYYGEVIDDCKWLGIAEQRHEGTPLYQQIDSDNEYIFIHVQANETGPAREGTVRMLGKNGYYELRIRQEGS